MTMKKLDKKVLIGKSLKGNNFISSFYFNNKMNSGELASEQF